ncbi:hypothetical protein DW198_17675, partial [Bacteroides fragilis]
WALRIKKGCVSVLTQPHTDSWARVPGLMGTPARNRMQIAPFPVKQQGKTKCFKRCICLSKAYL